jgi:5-carboxymethyl-2-hydroxymuconate isomerase
MLWIFGSLVGVFGILGTLTFLGFIPVLAPFFAVILNVFFTIIRALLSTRIGVAILTAFVVACIVYPLADIRGRSDIKAEWAAADIAATKAAVARDAHIAAEATAEAAAENEAIKQTSDQLAQKVADYEAELAKRPANGACTLNADDVSRLRDISGQGKSKATSSNLNGLRAIGNKSPAAAH